MKKKNIIIVIAVIFAIGIISAGSVYKFVINKPHQDYEKAKPAYIISAADLFDSYRSDRNLAEKKYNGQVVLLNGIINKVEISDSMVTGVFVFEQGMFGDEGIRCLMLPQHEARLKSYAVGSEIQLKGYLTGYNDTDIILEQCSVIR